MDNRQKQNLLQFLGLYDGAIDGIWGPKSQEAMKSVREKYAAQDDTTALLTAVADWKPDVTDNNVGNTGTFWDDIEHFDRSEFKCTCGGRGCNGYPEEPRERLVRNADSARKHFGRPAIVSSGVRCQLRNSELPGSAANSLHLTGRAMDFAIPGVSAATLEAYVRTLPEVHECYSIDGSYVHMGVEKY
jgi:peptidoglycan hydrolase-like protein with peptidoglycan-binding domain